MVWTWTHNLAANEHLTWQSLSSNCNSKIRDRGWAHDMGVVCFDQNSIVNIWIMLGCSVVRTSVFTGSWMCQVPKTRPVAGSNRSTQCRLVLNCNLTQMIALIYVTNDVWARRQCWSCACLSWPINNSSETKDVNMKLQIVPFLLRWTWFLLRVLSGESSSEYLSWMLWLEPLLSSALWWWALWWW